MSDFTFAGPAEKASVMVLNATDYPELDDFMTALLNGNHKYADDRTWLFAEQYYGLSPIHTAAYAVARLMKRAREDNPLFADLNPVTVSAKRTWPDEVQPVSILRIATPEHANITGNQRAIESLVGVVNLDLESLRSPLVLPVTL